MNCVILFHINDGPVQAVQHCDETGAETGELYEFGHIGEAVAYILASDHPFSRLIESEQLDYQIVVLDEL